MGLLAKSGASDGPRIILREFGIRTLERASYPHIDRKFVVEFDPVWRWTAKGVREPGVLKFAQDMIRPGATVFDVGAHIGEWTILFSELVGEAGRVVAFEPDPVARASLQKNLMLNSIRNVSVEASSVSDRVGTASLSAERFGSGLSSIIGPHDNPSRYSHVEVASTTLDEYCDVHQTYPDWVKIDAEGAEPLIVSGMRGLIESHHPSVILEFHSDSLNEAEKQSAWSEVTSGALSVEFLQSRHKDHGYLEVLPKGYVPDCGFLVVYIEY